MPDTIYIVDSKDKTLANLALKGVGDFNRGAHLCRSPSKVVTHYAIATEVDLSKSLAAVPSLEKLDGGDNNESALSAAGYEPKTATVAL